MRVLHARGARATVVGGRAGRRRGRGRPWSSAGYDGFEDLWQPLELGVGPAGAYAVSLARERRVALKDEVRRRLGVGDEPFGLTARAWVVTGRVR